ncbi:MAG: type pilus assembly protein PilM [Patescibacteria group bacterium]|jgi:type IV pilus assembly protein PilM|nr:type pilus assembly protein PilM [Patescibacteria group bacterium]
MANFFSKTIGSILGKRGQSVLGIDIGSSSIKIVQLSRKNGHAVLETYGELALGPYAGKSVGEATSLPPEKVVEAILDMLKEKEVNVSTRVCGVAIPFASSLMAVMEMPVQPQKQLEIMVPVEARKYIPVPISEVALDWYIIPKDKNPDTEQVPEPDAKLKTQNLEVLIVALHNDTLVKYKDIVTKTQLDASFFEIEIFSTMRSILDQEITPVLIVDMGATSTKLYIVERGILRSSHSVNRGSQSITDELSKSLGISVVDAEYLKREKGLIGEVNGVKVKEVVTLTLNYIFSESNRVILAYQKKYNKNVSKVVLVGGGSALKGVVDVAKESFQTEVVAGDPFAKVVAPAFLEKVLHDTGPEFAVAVGVALRRLQELD